jgi:hypothetical protein
VRSVSNDQNRSTRSEAVLGPRPTPRSDFALAAALTANVCALVESRRMAGSANVGDGRRLAGLARVVDELADRVDALELAHSTDRYRGRDKDEERDLAELLDSLE